MASGGRGRLDDFRRIETREQGTRTQTRGNLHGFAMSFSDCRYFAAAICETPLHPSRLQWQPGFSEQFDCFLKVAIRLASIAFGASRFSRNPAESGTGLRIVIVLGNRIQNIKAVSGIARTIVVRIKRGREE